MNAWQLYAVIRQFSLILVGILLVKMQISDGLISEQEAFQYLAYVLSMAWVAGGQQAFLVLAGKVPFHRQLHLMQQIFLVFSVLGLVVTGVGFWRDGWLFQQLVNQDDLTIRYGYLGIYVLVFSTASLLEIWLLLKERYKAILWLGGVYHACMLAIITLGLWYFADINKVILSLTVLTSLKLVWALWEWRQASKITSKHSHQRPEPDTCHHATRHRNTGNQSLLKEWMHEAFPLALYALLGSLNLVIDMWLVGYFYAGEETTIALYRFGGREFPLFLSLTASFSLFFVPRLGDGKDAEPLGKLRQESLRLMHRMLPVALLMMAIAPWVFPVVFNPQYAQSAQVFQCFLFISVSRMVFSHTVLMAQRQSKVILVVSLLELLLHAAFSYLGGLYGGIVGIALGGALACVLEKGFQMLWLYFRHGLPPSVYTSPRWLVLYSLGLALLFWITR